MSGKNTTMWLYIVSGGVPLIRRAFVFKRFVCVCCFFVFLFGLIFGVPKNGCGAFIWKLCESLKARHLHQQVCVLLVFLYWFCPGLQRHTKKKKTLWLPPLLLENSDSFEAGPSLAVMVSDWRPGSRYRNSRLGTWNGAIRSWEPSPWKHMLRKGIFFRFFQKIKKVNK